MSAPLTPERLQQVERVFQRARRLPRNRRAVFVRRTCSGNPALRHEVESLLEQMESARGAFLSGSILGAGFKLADADTIAESDATPRQIGRYRVLRKLGEGGMGAVYLAEQTGTQRRVALKVLRFAARSNRMLRRFELEARLLGRLRHPGIAQVYETGVHEDAGGRVPYIVMELIQGLPLQEYLRTRRPDQRGRLGIFLRICDAVHHAHQKGVIHRDLKPGNILVEEPPDSDAPHATRQGHAGSRLPETKVLDFGVALATDSDVQRVTRLTDQGQLLGTLQYMSPEQAAGDPADIDVRSDVYALGVILYEMLTDRLPYAADASALPEMVRAIRDDEPVPLRRVDQRIAADLATIVSKSLEKDRARRYQSASTLAEDIQRYLNDEPITAHPPSAFYQLRKFARRHRTLVMGSAALLIVLAAATAISTSLALAAVRARHEQEQARRVAERRLEDVRQLAGRFIFDFDDQIRFLNGSLPARQMIVTTGLAYLDQLARESADDSALRLELARAYRKLAGIQYDFNVADIGDTAGAAQTCRKALELLEPLAGAELRDAMLEMVRCRVALADALSHMQKPDEAMQHLRRAEAMIQRLLANGGGDAQALRDLDTVLGRLYILQRTAGNLPAAARTLDQAGAVLEQLIALGHEGTNIGDMRRGLAINHFRRGMLELAESSPEAARISFEAYLHIIGALHEQDPLNVLYLGDLTTGHERLGEALAQCGLVDDALAEFRMALRMAQDMLAAAPDNADALASVGAQSCRIGELELAAGNIAAASESFGQYVRTAELRAACDVGSAAARRELGVAHYKIAQCSLALAEDESLAVPTRLAHWIDAEHSLGRCLATFEDMQAHSMLAEADVNVPAEIRAEIARCEEAIMRSSNNQ